MHGTNSTRAAAVIGVSLLTLTTMLGGTAWAAASTTHTEHITIDDNEAHANPCTAAAGTLTTTGRGTMHQTLNADGSEHDAIALEGDARFTPDGPSSLTYTGHFTLTYEENDTQPRSGITTVVHIEARAADGSRLLYDELGRWSSGNGWSFDLDRTSVRCA
jgi:hypothetical protein